MQTPRIICPECGLDNIHNNIYIIGIAGPLDSGKSTMAKMLASRFESAIIPFAKPVKDLAKLMGWDGEKGKKGRRLLQLLGTECGRQCIDQNIWVNHWKDLVYRTTLPEVGPMLIVADDVRFDNECDIIDSLGGRLIKINGRNDVESPEHASELGLSDDRFSHLYTNNRGLDSMSTFCDQLQRKTNNEH